MVDAEDVALVEGLQQDVVQRQCRIEVVAEGLLDDDARALGAARAGELLDDGTEQRRRDGQVVRRPPGVAGQLAQGDEGRRVGVVARDIAQQPGKMLEIRRVQAAVLLDARARWRNCSMLQPARATPMTGKFR
jgi:hypothetical protein